MSINYSNLTEIFRDAERVSIYRGRGIKTRIMLWGTFGNLFLGRNSQPESLPMTFSSKSKDKMKINIYLDNSEPYIQFKQIVSVTDFAPKF